MARNLGSILTALLVVVALSSAAHALDRVIRQYQHTAWTAKDGAPPDIWALDQGPDGFLWLGTGSGLYRFDGIRFEPFRPQAGERLASIDITSVKVVSASEIWVGYSGGGVSRIKDGRVTTYTDKDGIWPGMVVHFRQGRDGVLWAVSHGGIARFEQDRWRRLDSDWGIPSGMIVGLFLARDGTAWLSTVDSLYFLRPGSRRFEPTGAVTSHAVFVQTQDDRIWVADSLYGIRPLPDYPAGDREGPWTVSKAASGDAISVASFAVDQEGVIWGTERINGGIFRFDPRRTPQPPHSLHASDVPDVFRRADGLTADRSIPILCDREDTIWVGTNGGLNRFRRGDIVPDLTVPPPTTYGYSIAATPDATFVSDGFWLYRAAPNQPVRPFARLPSPGFVTLFQTRSGALLYDNDHVLNRLQDAQLSRIAPPPGLTEPKVVAIAEDGDAALWVVFSRSGLYRLKDGVWGARIDLGSLPLPIAAEPDPGGPIWFGYSGSRVSRHDATGMRVYGPGDGLEVGNVEVISVIDGVVWVGGEFGLARLEGDRFHSMGPERGGGLLGVSGIGQTADGDLLFNGLMGVVRMKPAEVAEAFADPAYAPAFDLYDRRNGLPGVAQQGWGAPTIVSGADGRIWLISNTGISYLSADGRERNPMPPPVSILAVAADGAEYPPDVARLPEGTSSLAISYTAAALKTPERVQFRYRLEGLDTDWIDAGMGREAVYGNLGPGRYSFVVIAANEDGVWNTDGARVALEIPPTFLQSWIFKALCVATLLGLMWLAYMQRMRIIANRIRAGIAERVQERERIARELHDTLLQSAQALTLRFQLAVDDLPNGAAARPALEEAIDRADTLIAEGRDRVRDLRPLQDGAVEQIIADLVKRQGFGPEIDVSVATDGLPRMLYPLILDEVTRIAGEAIFNIWRHAQATRVTIGIDYASSFALRFADNGIGIAAAIAEGGGKEGHFGLPGMRERAERLRSLLLVRRLLEGGTEITLVIPGSVAYKGRMGLWRFGWQSFRFRSR